MPAWSAPSLRPGGPGGSRRYAACPPAQSARASPRGCPRTSRCRSLRLRLAALHSPLLQNFRCHAREGGHPVNTDYPMWNPRATPRWLWVPACAGTTPSVLSALPYPEYLGGEARIDLGELRCDHGAQEPQLLRRRGGRHRHVRAPVEVEAGVLDHLGDRVPGMHAREREAPPPAVEGEQAAVGDQRDRTARAMDVVGACSGRADEVDLRHQRAPRVLEPEQDHLGHDVIEVGRAERAGETRLRVRVVADADEVDVGLAVDLRARKEERVDPPLAGAVEELPPAVGEEALPPAAEQRDL